MPFLRRVLTLYLFCQSRQSKKRIKMKTANIEIFKVNLYEFVNGKEKARDRNIDLLHNKGADKYKFANVEVDNKANWQNLKTDKRGEYLTAYGGYKYYITWLFEETEATKA